jgi:hypothetical protein
LVLAPIQSFWFYDEGAADRKLINLNRKCLLQYRKSLTLMFNFVH